MNIILLIVGLIIGPFLNAQIIFPIIYFFPKSIVLAIKGELRIVAIFMSLITPIIIFIILISIGFFFPSIVENKYVLNPYLAIGMNISTIGMLGYTFLTKKGRSDLKSDFWKFMHDYTVKNIYEELPEEESSFDINKNLINATYSELKDKNIKFQTSNVNENTEAQIKFKSKPETKDVHLEDLKIEATNILPFINLNTDGNLSIEGVSMAVNSVNLYDRICEWLQEYKKNPANITTMNIRLEKLNSASSQGLLTVFKYLEAINKQGYKVTIHWLYKKDNKEIFEAGQDYEQIVNLKFCFIENI